MAEPNQPLWFAGVCDRLLAKVQWWFTNYEKGEISRTRKALDMGGKVVDVPLQYLHAMPFRQQEVDHLVRITAELRPKQAGLLELLRVLQRDLKKYRLLGTGERLAPLPFYKQDVKDMLDALLDAKAGLGREDGSELQKRKDSGQFIWG
jgi:hypothetical protein